MSGVVALQLNVIERNLLKTMKQKGNYLKQGCPALSTRTVFL
jgi:hypothetical protein